MDNSRLEEIQEARYAGMQALEALRKAEEKLSSAKNWGLWDMLGGGVLTTWMKHSKVDDAVKLMETARQKLQMFQKELRDVELPVEFGIEISDFLTFADYFFDGVIADWMVQSKIQDAKKQVEEAIRKVESILNRLDKL